MTKAPQVRAWRCDGDICCDFRDMPPPRSARLRGKLNRPLPRSGRCTATAMLHTKAPLVRRAHGMMLQRCSCDLRFVAMGTLQNQAVYRSLKNVMSQRAAHLSRWWRAHWRHSDHPASRWERTDPYRKDNIARLRQPCLQNFECHIDVNEQFRAHQPNQFLRLNWPLSSRVNAVKSCRCDDVGNRKAKLEKFGQGRS